MDDPDRFVIAETFNGVEVVYPLNAADADPTQAELDGWAARFAMYGGYATCRVVDRFWFGYPHYSQDQLDALAGPALRVVADPSATRGLSDVVRSSRDARMLLAIGPEVGWNAFELGLLAAHGFQPAGMGPRTLRSDTACVALLAIVHALRSG